MIRDTDIYYDAMLVSCGETSQPRSFHRILEAFQVQFDSAPGLRYHLKDRHCWSMRSPPAWPTAPVLSVPLTAVSNRRVPE